MLNLDSVALTPNSINKLSFTLTKVKSGACIMVRSKQSGEVLCRRNITTGKLAYNTVFKNASNEELQVEIVAVDLDESVINIVEVKYVCDIYRDTGFETNDDSVTAAIATYPPRINVLPKAVDSLIDQVDHLYVYLNNYRDVPEFILNHPLRKKISYVLDSASEKRAAAKFYWVNKIRGIHLTCDDDIIYPSDYVKKMLACLSSVEKGSVVGVHSVIYKENAIDPIASREHVFNFRRKLSATQKVHLVGTGTLCFQTDTLNIDGFSDLWKFAASTDEWLACFSKSKKINLYTPGRKDNWMLAAEGVDFGLHEEKQINTALRKKAADLISNNSPWKKITLDDQNHSDIYPGELERKFKKFRKTPGLFFLDMLKNLKRGNTHAA